MFYFQGDTNQTRLQDRSYTLNLSLEESFLVLTENYSYIKKKKNEHDFELVNSLDKFAFIQSFNQIPIFVFIKINSNIIDYEYVRLK